MIPVPSDLIIQKENVPGYNNVLTLATKRMKFGKNTNVNYKAKQNAPPATTKVTQNESPSKTTQGGFKTDPLSQGDKVTKTVTTQETKTPTHSSQGSQKTTRPTGSSLRSVTPASEVLGVTMMIGGLLISKYIL